MRKVSSFILIATCLGMLLFIRCQENERTGGNELEISRFLEIYSDSFLQLYTTCAEATWRIATGGDRIDTAETRALERARNNFAAFTGNAYHIKTAENFLKKKSKLTEVERRQLDRILYLAARNPWNVQEVNRQRIGKEVFQEEFLTGYQYSTNDSALTFSEIRQGLREGKEAEKRLRWWEASKEPGRGMGLGLTELRDMRNASVRGMEYKNFFQYRLSEYGMSESEMLTLLEQLVSRIWPLYREVHTWARYELAERYGMQEVPDMIPAHWLPDPWGMDWSALEERIGMKDELVRPADAVERVRKGEAFFRSLGFSALPAGFYKNSEFSFSSKKERQASALYPPVWHMNLRDDVRMIMEMGRAPEEERRILEALGRAYYFLSYSQDEEVPVLLRVPANRSFPGAVGGLAGFAAGQPVLPIDSDRDIDRDSIEFYSQLLREALYYVVSVPFSAGVMAHFEYTLYNTSIDIAGLNAEWWKLRKKYQGIVPPYDRKDGYYDAAAHPCIVLQPAECYDYALSSVLLFQLHAYISEEILGTDLHTARYSDRQEVGEFLKSMMDPGAGYDGMRWLRKHMRHGFSAEAMDAYFRPLVEYLKRENRGRKYTLPVRVL